MIDIKIFQNVIKAILTIGGFLSIFWIGGQYKTHRLSEKLELSELDNKRLADSLTFLNEKILELNQNKPSNLIVFNNSAKEKMFHFMDIVEGRGKGMPIRPNTFREFYLNKGAYNWYYHNKKSDAKSIDTLQKGNTVYKHPEWKKVIVMN